MMPWERPPVWMYLPHVSAIAGHEIVGSDEDGRMQFEGGLSGGDNGGAGGGHAEEIDGTARNATASGMVWGSAGAAAAEQSADPYVHARGIRGRGHTPGPRARGGAGASLRVHAAGDMGEHAPSDASRRAASGTIRGQAPVPGAAAGDGRSRAQAAIDARLSSISQSIRDHAERVEAKRARSGAMLAGATAAARLEALRRRVAARSNNLAGEEAGLRGDSLFVDAAPVDGGSGSVDAPRASASCVHAATRDAQHDLSPGPGGEGHRRLRS